MRARLNSHSLLPLAVVALGCLFLFTPSGYIDSLKSGRHGYAITDEAGLQIVSAFEGVHPANERLSFGPVTTSRCQATAGKQSTFLSLTDKLFSVGTVQAQGLVCQEGSCGGHYMMTDMLECPPACFGSLRQVYSDPSVPYGEGWRWAGLVDCPNACATCAVRTCSW